MNCFMHMNSKILSAQYLQKSDLIAVKLNVLVMTSGYELCYFTVGTDFLIIKMTLVV